MTLDELITRLRTRGGDIRVTGERVQYRPAGVLTPDEVAWLAQRRTEVARALTKPTMSEDALPLDGPPFGSAGPDVPAWHCRLPLGASHVPGVRSDGSACATCHPPTLELPRRLS